MLKGLAEIVGDLGAKAASHGRLFVAKINTDRPAVTAAHAPAHKGLGHGPVSMITLSGYPATRKAPAEGPTPLANCWQPI